MIQLCSLGEDDCFSMDIVRDHLHKVQNKQYKEIAKAMGLQLEEIMEAIEIVKALDPRPGQKYNRRRRGHDRARRLHRKGRRRIQGCRQTKTRFRSCG